MQGNPAHRICGSQEPGRRALEAQAFDELTGRLPESSAKITLEVKSRSARPGRHAGQGQTPVKMTVKVPEKIGNFPIPHGWS
ncbi:MAG TPA: hypothetical protein VGM97_10880 [Steroidobacteraceae bacterium]